MSNNNMTKLDLTLQDMATVNWEQFVSLIGIDAIQKAKTCLLRGGGHSYGEIGMTIGVDKNVVRHWCAKCEPNK